VDRLARLTVWVRLPNTTRFRCSRRTIRVSRIAGIGVV
jgi:hypothetical protein